MDAILQRVVGFEKEAAGLIAGAEAKAAEKLECTRRRQAELDRELELDLIRLREARIRECLDAEAARQGREDAEAAQTRQRERQKREGRIPLLAEKVARQYAGSPPPGGDPL